jgi:hypothetical protein
MRYCYCCCRRVTAGEGGASPSSSSQQQPAAADSGPAGSSSTPAASGADGRAAAAAGAGAGGGSVGAAAPAASSSSVETGQGAQQQQQQQQQGAQSRQQPDFVLAIGDDRSDEEMFLTIEQNANTPAHPAMVSCLQFAVALVCCRIRLLAAGAIGRPSCCCCLTSTASYGSTSCAPLLHMLSLLSSSMFVDVVGAGVPMCGGAAAQQGTLLCQ